MGDPKIAADLLMPCAALQRVAGQRRDARNDVGNELAPYRLLAISSFMISLVPA